MIVSPRTRYSDCRFPDCRDRAEKNAHGKTAFVYKYGEKKTPGFARGHRGFDPDSDTDRHRALAVFGLPHLRCLARQHYREFEGFPGILSPKPTTQGRVTSYECWSFTEKTRRTRSTPTECKNTIPVARSRRRGINGTGHKLPENVLFRARARARAPVAGLVIVIDSPPLLGPPLGRAGPTACGGAGFAPR